MLEPEPDPEPKDYYYYTDHSLTVLRDADGLAFVFDAETVVHAAAVDYITRDAYSTCALYTDTEGALCYVNRNGYTKIADGVISCAMSLYGDYVIYLRRGVGARRLLCRYDTKKKLSSVIESSAYFTDDADLVLSPDGTTLAYSKNFRVGGADDVYLSEDGKPGVLLEGVGEVVCLANEGRYLLWHSDTQKYYLRTRDTDLYLDTDLPSTIIANRECTEFVYAKSTGGTFLVTGGNDVTRLTDEVALRLCFPTYTMRGESHIAMINHFRVKLFTCAATISGRRGLCYIGSRQTDTVYERVSLPADDYVSYNLTILYYIEDGRLIKFNRQHPDQTTVLSENAVSGSLLLSKDGKELFFTDTDKSLCRVSGGAVSTVVPYAEQICISSDGTVYYRDATGAFCYVRNGTPAQLSFQNTDGRFISSGEDVFIFSKGRLYALSGGTVPLMLCENAESIIVAK